MIDNRLKELREKKGITQKQLSELSCVSLSLIIKLERGARKINNAQLINIKRIADVLECSIEDLILEVDECKINC